MRDATLVSTGGRRRGKAETLPARQVTAHNLAAVGGPDVLADLADITMLGARLDVDHFEPAIDQLADGARVRGLRFSST
jgi:hypothetical protein